MYLYLIFFSIPFAHLLFKLFQECLFHSCLASFACFVFFHLSSVRDGGTKHVGWTPRAVSALADLFMVKEALALVIPQRPRSWNNIDSAPPQIIPQSIHVDHCHNPTIVFCKHAVCKCVLLGKTCQNTKFPIGCVRSVGRRSEKALTRLHQQTPTEKQTESSDSFFLQALRHGKIRTLRCPHSIHVKHLKSFQPRVSPPIRREKGFSASQMGFRVTKKNHPTIIKMAFQVLDKRIMHDIDVPCACCGVPESALAIGLQGFINNSLWAKSTTYRKTFRRANCEHVW